MKKSRFFLWSIYIVELLVSEFLINQKSPLNFIHPAAWVALILNLGATWALIEILLYLMKLPLLSKTKRTRTVSYSITSILFTCYLIATLGAIDYVPRMYHIAHSPYLDVLAINMIGGLAIFFWLRRIS